jgi:hypothetical protein
LQRFWLQRFWLQRFWWQWFCLLAGCCLVAGGCLLARCCLQIICLQFICLRFSCLGWWRLGETGAADATEAHCGMAPMAIHPPGKARQPAHKPTWWLPIEISWPAWPVDSSSDSSSWASTACSLAL